ncbi:hypothetical protein FRB97_005421 [Tulasnella sp. 331]|nr:hypothetical protein FRB97_005421 [Tulasnella sp. 331]
MSSVSASEIHLGSEKSIALQDSIQKQLALKGYSQEDDTVMAEYITIMLVNDKSSEQVTLELTESKNDPNLGVTESTAAAQNAPLALTTAGGPNISGSTLSSAAPTTNTDGRSQGHHTRPLYQQAISALPSGSTSQKRSSSQRTPSPSGGPPSKRRQADLPDRPRAMRDENPAAAVGVSVNVRGNRLKNSLLDRVGPKTNPNGPDLVQERIRSVTQQQQQQRSQMPGPNMHNPQMMPGGPFPAGQMDPAAMTMMMQQGFNPAMMNGGFAPNGIEATMMAIQQFGQLAMQMGLVPGPMGMMGPGGPMHGGGGPGGQRFQGGGMGGPGMSRHGSGVPRNGPGSQGQPPLGNQQRGPGPSDPTVHAPTPVQPAAVPLSNSNALLRPLSPTLCKFVTNCNNPTCRYSHPSPVSTLESGVVLSTDPCEKGIECADKDCIYAHVSKAAKNAPSTAAATTPAHPPAATTLSQAPCKFDPNCTRPNCPYYHPSHKHRVTKTHSQANNSSSVACRFGSACTRSDCPYTHPPGRVLPGQFSRGLDGAPPSLVTKAPGVDKESWNKSVDFRSKGTGSPAKDMLAARAPTEGKANGKLNPTAPSFTPSSAHSAPAADPVEAA